MSRKSSDDAEPTRRSILKAAGVAAVGITAGVTGTGPVSAADRDEIDTEGCNCSYEYGCDTSRWCSTHPDPQSPYVYQRRECCTCNGETICSSWDDVGCC